MLFRYLLFYLTVCSRSLFVSVHMDIFFFFFSFSVGCFFTGKLYNSLWVKKLILWRVSILGSVGHRVPVLSFPPLPSSSDNVLEIGRLFTAHKSSPNRRRPDIVHGCSSFIQSLGWPHRLLLSPRLQWMSLCYIFQQLLSLFGGWSHQNATAGMYFWVMTDIVPTFSF